MSDLERIDLLERQVNHLYGVIEVTGSFRAALNSFLLEKHPDFYKVICKHNRKLNGRPPEWEFGTTRCRMKECEDNNAHYVIDPIKDIYAYKQHIKELI